MSAIDPQQASQGNSTNAFLTSLVVNAALLLVEVGTFIVLKRRLWRIYTPRAHLPPPNKRAPQLPSGPWRWIPALLTYPPEDIIQKNGLDAYMFLRFIKLLAIISFVFTALTFIVIIPVDYVGVKTELEGLERITWTNLVDPREQRRQAAHIVVVYILTGFVVYMIFREMQAFTHRRHDFLLSKAHMRLAQSRTVLITAVPSELSTEHELRTFASFVPGGVDRVWMYRDSRELNELFERRQEVCSRLEAAGTALLFQATKVWKKKLKLQSSQDCGKKGRDVESLGKSRPIEKPEPSARLFDELVPAIYRPKHRPKLFRPKVDTVEWCKAEIATLNTQIKKKRKEHVEGKFLGSAFIRCNLQMGAHILSQCLSYHEPLKMYDKWMEAHPKDVVWDNLDDGALEMRSRYVISWLATIGLIIVWAFPVGFIGTLSNLSELCVKVKWLAWVCHAPKLAQGIIEGVLPPVLLAGLFAVLPLILQALAWYECIPRYSLISVSVYRRFYLFLLIHGFLIVTLSSGITNAITDIIEQPTQTVQELAGKLPGASVFFLTYMVAQGLAGAGGAMAQLVPLVLYYLKKWFLGQTPRQAYEVTFMMPSADFGVILPRLSLLATITFAYSVLSPLINLLALISFGMFYIAWKFLFVHVFDQREEAETGGMYFPMAINNLCAGAIVKGAFMLALLATTACAHVFISHCFSPLVHHLPMSLATKKLAKRFTQERREQEGLNGEGSDDDEIDLFSRENVKNIRRRLRKISKKIDMLSIISVKTEKDREEINKTDASAAPTMEQATAFDEAAPRATLSDADSDDEEEQDSHAFDHPSTYQDQAWIWIPKDVLGLSGVLAKELRDAGVGASDIGAFMDERGAVEVRRNPPDEKWAGGQDA